MMGEGEDGAPAGDADEGAAAPDAEALRRAAESLDPRKLRRLWRAANIVAAFGFVIVAASVFDAARGDLEMALLALVLGAAAAYLSRCAVIFGLGAWRAPGLAAFIIETEVRREGEGLEVDTKHHATGDPTLDGYVKSFIEARARILKIASWAMVLVFLFFIMFIASLLGLVDFVW
ncbi:MAG: hypothetical protein AAGM38_16180 [Pseudomonadota bacterium]